MLHEKDGDVHARVRAIRADMGAEHPWYEGDRGVTIVAGNQGVNPAKSIVRGEP